MAGAQLIHDVGYMDNGKTGALDQLVICHEIIGWIKQYMKDVSINEETLALDLIDEVVKPTVISSKRTTPCALQGRSLSPIAGSSELRRLAGAGAG